MGAKEKYRFVEDAHEIRIKPNRGSTNYLWGWTIFLTICAAAIGYFYTKGELRNDGLRVSIAIWVFFVLYILYDLIFRLHITFIFDKYDRKIYRKNLITKEIMSFDEMTVFNKSDNTGLRYAIGKKRQQFIKSYPISDFFSKTNRSQRKEQDYVENVLNPILDAVENRH